MFRSVFLAIAAVSWVALLPPSGSAQSPCVGDQNIRANTEHFVNSAIWGTIWDGHVDKGLKVLGDSGVPIIERALAGKPLGKLQVETVLEMLPIAFSSLSEVPQAADRQPHVAFLLLRYLECVAHDDVTRKKVADTRRVLEGIARAEQAAEAAGAKP